MRRLLLAAAVAIGLNGGLATTRPALAQPASAPQAEQAKPKRVALILDPAKFDPGLVLRQPPAEGSQTQADELQVLRMIQRGRTAEQLERAKSDDAREDITIFSAALGPAFDLDALPATRAVLETVRNDQAIVAGVAKDYFKRLRPFVVDPSLDGCDHAKTKPLTSYPSGHATLGYSLGYVLAALMPEKADVIRARADDYAYNRMVCEAHYRSDLEAGRALGDWVGAQMLASPAFKPQLDAARAELKAKGLVR